VKYSIDGAADPDHTWFGISEYHLEVVDEFKDFADAKVSKLLNKKGSPRPGQCEYKENIGFRSDTGWIKADLDDISGYDDPIYIFAHAIMWWGY